MSLYLSTHSHPLAAHPARVALGEAAGGHQAVAAPGAGQRGQDRGLGDTVGMLCVKTQYVE